MAGAATEVLLKRAAADLEAQGYCLDVSGQRPSLLHSLTNRNLSTDTLRFMLADRGIKIQRTGIAADSKWSEVDEVLNELPRVHGSVFKPVDERFVEVQGVKFANTYRRPSLPETTPKSCEVGFGLLDDLLHRLFPKVEEALFVRQYFAHILTAPLRRPQFALLLSGAQGTGKSILIQCIERALGRHYVWRENDYQAAFKQFSEVFPNHLLVTFDDAPANSGRVQELLKHSITRTHQEIELKGVQRREQRQVFCRIVLLTNDENLFDLSEDRRFYVPEHIVHRESKQETQDFFDKFLSWMESSDADGVIHQWLQRTEMSGFKEASPAMTDRKQRLQGRKSDLNEFAQKYVSDGRIVHVKEIQLMASKSGFPKPSTTETEDALKAAKYIERRRPHPFAGETGRMICCWVPGDRKRARSLTDEEISRFQEANALD